MPSKNDVLHVRVTPEEKERIKEVAKILSEKDPYVCEQCETRFTEEKAYENKFVCPYCKGKIKKAEASASQIMRYNWKFMEGIQNYSFYDALLVMNNTGMMQVLNNIPLSSLDGVKTLGEAIDYVIRENVSIKNQLANMPFNIILRVFFAKTYNKLNNKK